MSDNNNNLFSNDFNGTFFLSLGTLFITGISVCLGFALKSKCKNVNVCFGCLEIDRDVELEADMEMNIPVVVPPPTITTTTDDIPPTVVRRPSVRRSSKIIDNTVAAIKALESDDETKI